MAGNSAHGLPRLRLLTDHGDEVAPNDERERATVLQCDRVSEADVVIWASQSRDLVQMTFRLRTVYAKDFIDAARPANSIAALPFMELALIQRSPLGGPFSLQYIASRIDE